MLRKIVCVAEARQLNFYIKGAICCSGEEMQTQTVDLFHKWINKLFSEQNKVLRMLFEATQVAGSATYKQS